MSKPDEPTPIPRAACVVIRLFMTTVRSLPNMGRPMSHLAAGCGDASFIRHRHRPHVRGRAQQQERRLRLPGDCQGDVIGLGPGKEKPPEGGFFDAGFLPWLASETRWLRLHWFALIKVRGSCPRPARPVSWHGPATGARCPLHPWTGARRPPTRVPSPDCLPPENRCDYGPVRESGTRVPAEVRVTVRWVRQQQFLRCLHPSERWRNADRSGVQVCRRTHYRSYWAAPRG
jgi:hypothetical protein